MTGKSITIIEGFDMVGKDTFIRETNHKSKIYHPSHDLTDATIGRDQSWVLGHSIVEFLEQTKGILNEEESLVINRCIASSIVYTRIYNNHNLPKEVVDWYKNNQFFKNEIRHIYIKHKNEKTAKMIYQLSQTRKVPDNLVSAKLDKFNSFDDYWRMYSFANLKFLEAFNELGIVPEIFVSDPAEIYDDTVVDLLCHFYQEGALT